MTLLPDANVTSIQVKRDNGGHILIKTSYAAATPSFQYTMKVMHPHLIGLPSLPRNHRVIAAHGPANVLHQDVCLR